MRANQWTGPRSLADQFWPRVETSDGCWTWNGLLQRKGYGYLSSQGRLRLAHRVSWELHFGPIPTGLFVCHRCDNPRCVRPDHLFVGTAADNSADMVAKGRQSKGPRPNQGPRRTTPRDLGLTCKRGHDRAIYTVPMGRTVYCLRCHADRQKARQRAQRAAA